MAAYDGAYEAGDSIGEPLQASAVTTPPSVRLSWWIVPASLALAVLSLVAAGASAFWLRFFVWFVWTGCIFVGAWAIGVALLFSESAKATADELEELNRAG